MSFLAIASLFACTTQNSSQANCSITSNDDAALSSLVNENEKLKSELEQQSKANQDNINSLNTAQEEISQQKETIDSLNSEISSLEEEIQSKEDSLSELEQSNNNLQNEIDSMKDTLDSTNRKYNSAGSFWEIEEDGVFEFALWQGSSGLMPNEIKVKGRNENTLFVLDTMSGSFWKENLSKDRISTTAIVNNGDYICWRNYSVDNAHGYGFEKTYVKAYMLENEILVGYGVIAIEDRNENLNQAVSFMQHPSILKCAYVDGNVSQEQINKAIDQVIQNDPFGKMYSYSGSDIQLCEETGLYEIQENIIDVEQDSFTTPSVNDSFYLNQIIGLPITGPGVLYRTYSTGMNIGYDAGMTNIDSFYPGESIYISNSIKNSDENSFTPSKNYLKVTVESFGNLFGYALVEISRNTFDSFNVSILKSAITPAIWGQKQQITKENLISLMDSMIEENK